MSEDFKPGTRPLLRLAGLDAARSTFISRAEESHALWAAVLTLAMRLHFEPTAEARRSSGAADNQVVTALRVVLAENFGLEVADYVSWVLILYGCRQKPTLASLHPWERLMFEWQERKATTPRIALWLRDAGLERPLRASSLEALDNWITNPVSALGEASHICAALFGPRLVTWNLHDDGEKTPEHDALFMALMASILPSSPVGLPRERLERRDGGDRWVVEYTHGGRQLSFEAVAKGTEMDVDGVMEGADDLLARLGRPERVFRLVPGRAGNWERGLFVVADATRFAELVFRLRLPLLRSPTAADLPETVALPVAEAPGVVRAPPPPVVRSTSRVQPTQPAPLTTSGPSRGDAMSMLESRFSHSMPLERGADPSMRGLVASLRRSFGAGRMLQGSRWMKQTRAEAPAWLKAGADPIAGLYEKQEVLFRKGRIVWGALVGVDDRAFSAGADDLPGVMLFGTEDYFDARPAELSAIAARMRELKGLPPGGGAELVAFLQRVRNDSARPLNLAVPSALSSREVLMTSFMAIRAHLPDGVLAADWFPVLIHPSTAFPLIVPAAYWPQALLEAWRDRSLCVDPHQGVGG
jgi:hypothetical protein